MSLCVLYIVTVCIVFIEDTLIELSVVLTICCYRFALYYHLTDMFVVCALYYTHMLI